jgi:hypothetical protein
VKIYEVQSETDEGWDSFAIFSAWEKAESYIAKYNDCYNWGQKLEISETEVDTQDDAESKVVVTAHFDLKTKTVSIYNYSAPVKHLVKKDSVVGYVGFSRHQKLIVVHTYTDEEHAKKVAQEAYQYYLSLTKLKPEEIYVKMGEWASNYGK